MRTSPFPVRRLVVLTAFAFAAVLCGTARGATFVVNSTLDAGDAAPGNGSCDDGAGHCTLRAAIEEANALSGPDVIHFAIPGGGVHTFQPATDFPPLSGPVVIDGYTQPGASPNSRPFGQGGDAVLLIELDGSLAGTFFNIGLRLSGGDANVRGLVINRFSGPPVFLSSDRNHVEGCYFGTDANGSVELDNGFGVYVQGSDNWIGGDDPAARNVIIGLSDGVFVVDGTQHNHIVGNFIGPDASGTVGLGNQFSGIQLRGPGTEVRKNVVSANRFGMWIGVFGDGSNTVVQGNYVGTDASGMFPMGNNGAGIRLEGDLTGCTIGGSGPGEGNVIAYNFDVFNQSGAGVTLAAPPGVPRQNRISGNSIFGNAGLGIDQDPAGVNPNDPGDPDAGTNDGQNYPVLSSAQSSGGTTTIAGTLNAEPLADFQLEFFSNPSCDPSGYGEGQVYLGATTVTTNGGGIATFSAPLNVSVMLGHRVTATATDAQGNTSEFSACVEVTGTTAAMGFDFKPHDLHLNSHGKWVTGFLRPSDPHLASEIDVASIRLNGVVSVAPGQPAKIEDHDARLKVKFLRAEVAPTLSPGNHVAVTVTGTIAGQPFTGTDYIKVKAPKIHHPAPGEIVAAGTTTEVTWDLADTPVPTVTLLSSFDDGVTWQIEAEGIANTGHYAWTVPHITSRQARLAVQMIYETDETGVVPESEFAESDPFTIAATTGVEGDRATLALRPASLVTGQLTMTFSLASGASATLAAYDVSGRQVVSREVGSSGPGWHTMEFGSHPAGVYVVRLSQAGRTLSARVAVIR